MDFDCRTSTGSLEGSVLKPYQHGLGRFSGNGMNGITPELAYPKIVKTLMELLLVVRDRESVKPL